MEKQQKYSIYAEGHFLQSVSPAELRMIHCLISDFFNKEDKIQVAGRKVNTHPENYIFIAKAICFDSRTRDFQTEYSICVGDDSLTNISDGELVNLYLTLQSFLIQSEKFPAEIQKENLTPETKGEAGVNIEITLETIDNYLIHPCKDSPYSPNGYGSKIIIYSRKANTGYPLITEQLKICQGNNYQLCRKK